MEAQHQHQKAKRKQQAARSKAAQERNARLLQDMKKMEDDLRKQPLLHPDVITLQTRYWASVEQKLPEWEPFLLGKGPAPTEAGSRSPGKRPHNPSPRNTKARGLPPRPPRHPAV
ncbi:centrosomal protein 15 isoform X2 [Denticeps clupeoides]|nr:uncharacterized protein C3orf14 homolog isoform X2 [Denticeps clupeoides]